MPPPVNQFTTRITEKVELSLQTPNNRHANKQAQERSSQKNEKNSSQYPTTNQYIRQVPPEFALLSLEETPSQSKTANPPTTNLEQNSVFKSTAYITGIGAKIFDRHIFSIKSQQLGGRVVLGHINQFTFEFVQICKPDGTSLCSES